MSSSMPIAFAQAEKNRPTRDVLVPIKQRVWTWLKDKGPGYKNTAKQIALALNLTQTRVSSECHILAGRGMLLRTLGQNLTSTPFGMRDGVSYAAVGREYILAPPSAKQRKATRKANKRPESKPHSSAPTRIAVSVSNPAPPIPANPTPKNVAVQGSPGVFDIEQYTLGQLRGVYQQLQALFGK